jgi:hypothetical protein
MAEQISWFATAATILAALVTASNLGARITGYGFVIFLFGSIAWLSVGTMTGQPALLWTNAALTLLNIWGIWRWLGRQAQLEKGSEAALEASIDTPGELLFPASILGRSPLVDSTGAEIGRTVDAMVGGRSGRLHYLVVSAGGIGGVGERLHRVDWADARFEEDAIKLSIDREQFASLPEVPKDHWPAR